MPKAYKIVKTIKDQNGTLESFITKSGMQKTKQEVINDLNSGYSVFTQDKHGHSKEVINVNNDYVRTLPNSKKCDNLEDL